MDLFQLANELYTYLTAAGIKFTDEGYPIITENMLLREMPEQVLPIKQTYAAKDKKKVFLVSFSNDENIYKKLLSLKKDIPFYKQFLGFGGFDLSPRINWDIKLQKFNMALNRMGDAYLAVNGVKIMPNFRTGCLETMSVLSCYPPNAWYTVGVLGCASGHIKINEMYLRTKLLLNYLLQS